MANPERNTTPDTPREIAANYGQSWAVISSDPGLLAWFNDFAKRFTDSHGQISQQTFELELQQQEWWKNHSASWIADYKQQLDNPTDWNQSVNAQVESYRDRAAQLGANVSDQILRDMVIAARRGGWGQSQVDNELAKYVSGSQRGQAGQVADDFAAWSYRNGVQLSPTQVQRYQQQIAAGDLTEDDVKRQIRQSYMLGAYPAWADQINAGMDVADIAGPYKQAMGQLLEVDPDAVDMTDPLLQKALQGVDQNGKPAVVPLHQFMSQVRQDPRWQQTDNAYATYAGVARHVLSTFGFGS